MPPVAEPESAVWGGCGLVRSSYDRQADREERRTSALRDVQLGESVRPSDVFNLATWSAGAPILKAFADFNALIEKLTGPIGPPRHVVPS
jgi:hypothetical protein